MNKIALFPGSFSPFSLGHQSVVEIALPLFDKIVIGIGSNCDKDEFFSIRKRKEWIKKVYKNNNKVTIDKYEGLTIDYCKKIGAKYIIRGLRGSHDFRYERNIAHVNKDLDKDIETIFIMPPANLSHISSTIIRDIIENGGDASQFLPKEINI